MDQQSGGVTLVHVRAGRLPFAPMCVRLVGRAVSRRVTAFVPVGVLGEGVRSGRVVWPEATRAIFSKLRPPECLVVTPLHTGVFQPRLVGRCGTAVLFLFLNTQVPRLRL